MNESTSEPQSRAQELEHVMSRLRHDVRSALAPALLAADMLGTNPDPKVQRNSATVVRAIERVMGMLDATREIVPPHRPGDAAG